jgi:hypothetical protein
VEVMARRKLSVAVIVAATLVTVTTLLFGILATISYVSGHRREEERLRLGVAAQAEELAAALALPVWNIDRAQIDKILDSQARTPQVEAVIVDAAGRVQARVRDREGRCASSPSAARRRRAKSARWRSAASSAPIAPARCWPNWFLPSA